MIMAGSYEHLKRARPGEEEDEDNGNYGGVDTSLVENMGDAIEAMVHMYWMIELLAQGDRNQIKMVSDQALKIECGQREAPNWQRAETAAASRDWKVPIGDQPAFPMHVGDVSGGGLTKREYIATLIYAARSGR